MKTLLYKLYLVIVFVFLFFIGYAQSDLPPVYEIKTDTALFQTLDNSYYQLLEDSTNKLTIQQVMQKPVEDKFRYSKSSTNAFDFRIHTYWFRYTLKNMLARDAKISFICSDEQSDFYFIVPENKIVHKVTGLVIPLNKLNDVKIFNGTQVFPVILKPGEELIIYDKVYNSYNYFFSPGVFSIGYSNTEKLNEQSYFDTQSSYSKAIHDSILFGSLSFAALISFFFFLIVRERVYFYFSLYMLNLSLGRIGNEFHFIFFKNLPVLFSYFFEFIWLVNAFFMTLFIQSFLETKIYVPRWNRFLTWFNYLLLLYSTVMIIAFSQNPRVFDGIGTFSHILLTVCNLLSFFLVLNKSKNQKKILVVAILPAFAVWVVCSAITTLYQTFQFITFSNAFTVWVNNSWSF
ncbi:MAG TPA: 7TM-DISM domain-containing protein, partial [Parafilimonas sp.]|nr:7TM-DISM domain-containing protein [Parafilimonas sp.]